MQSQRHILLLGSGLMAESVAKHILLRPEVNFIMIQRTTYMSPVTFRNKQKNFKINSVPIDAPTPKLTLPILTHLDHWSKRHKLS